MVDLYRALSVSVVKAMHVFCASFSVLNMVVRGICIML